MQFCNSRLVEVITHEEKKSMRDITIHWSLTAYNVELSLKVKTHNNCPCFLHIQIWLVNLLLDATFKLLGGKNKDTVWKFFYQLIIIQLYDWNLRLWVTALGKLLLESLWLANLFSAQI